MNKLKSGRIILDERAKAALSSMYEELKNEKCIKITPAKLSGWIICEFQKNYFERYKRKICKDHFNSKEYLKGMIQNVDAEENLEDILRTALINIKTPKATKPSDKKSQPENESEA
jgi:hypothetical protein